MNGQWSREDIVRLPRPTQLTEGRQRELGNIEGVLDMVKGVLYCTSIDLTSRSTQLRQKRKASTGQPSVAFTGPCERQKNEFGTRTLSSCFTAYICGFFVISDKIERKKLVERHHHPYATYEELSGAFGEGTKVHARRRTFSRYFEVSAVHLSAGVGEYNK